MSDEFDVNKILGNVLPDEDEVKPVEKNESVPGIGDEAWTDYVLSLMAEDELYTVEEKNVSYPTVAGLRRVINRLFVIHESITTVNGVYTNIGDDFPTSTVTHTLKVSPLGEANGNITTWTGVATVGPFKGNTFGFPTECAETKAKGRAYTNLLSLKVCTKDELDTKTPMIKASQFISESQIKQLDTFCKRININVLKYVNSGEAKYNKITEVPSAKFALMWDFLNKLQQKQHNGATTVKDEELLAAVGSYTPNWR